LPYGHRRSLLEHPVPAAHRLPLRSAYQTYTGLDDDGVSTFPRSEIRPGWVPSIPRGQAVFPQPADLPRPPPAASQRLGPVPRSCSSSTRGSDSRGIIKGSLAFTRPAFPSPVTTGRIGSPWAHPRAPHPAVTRDARQGRDRHRTLAWTTHPTQSDLRPAQSLKICDLVSHGSLPGPPLRRLVRPHHPSHSGDGVPGRHPRAGSPARGVKGGEDPYASTLIPLSSNEIRRLFGRLAQLGRGGMAYALRWSQWRRRRQAQARAAHYRKRLKPP